MAIDIARWQFTIADYARMREVGILTEDDRVELIDGEVRPMSPIGSLHAALVNLLMVLLTRQIGDHAIVSVQNPIQLNDYSEPQPDVSILQPREDFYAAGHPRPDDVLLVVEVADSSIEYDRTEKLPRYAQAGITEVWIVDVEQRAIEQYTDPRNGRYHHVRLAEHGEHLTAHAIHQLVLSIDELFR